MLLHQGITQKVFRQTLIKEHRKLSVAAFLLNDAKRMFLKRPATMIEIKFIADVEVTAIHELYIKNDVTRYVNIIVNQLILALPEPSLIPEHHKAFPQIFGSSVAQKNLSYTCWKHKRNMHHCQYRNSDSTCTVPTTHFL